MNSLRNKIAQLICVEVRGNELDKDTNKLKQIKDSLKEHQWGSIILFDSEINQASQVVKELQELVEIPLFVCCDLERGTGQHFKGATNIPSNMAFGATKNMDLAYKAGKITAQEAKELGINVIFAPSVDVNNNPNNPIINIRSFGEDPVLVGDLAQAFISGCQIEGVIATAKHFPGHGDTSDDSHYKLPIIKKSRKALEKTELLPFKQVIQSGVAAIMSSHIAISALDKTLTPATLSKPIMTDLLRTELGFDGLVFTDAMIMDGVKSDKEDSIYVKAIQAGCDILLMPSDPVQALEDIEKALESNIISMDLIDTAYHRIIRYKQEYSLVNYKKDLKKINSIKNQNFSQLVAKESITKIKGTMKFPLDFESKRILNVLIDQDNDPEVWNMYSCKLNKDFKIKTFAINTNTEEENLKELEAKLDEVDIVILSFFSKIRAWKEHIYPNKKVLTWLDKELLAKKDTVVITFSNPYLSRKLNNIKNYYCTYSDSLESQYAILDVLFKGQETKGISPVTI